MLKVNINELTFSCIIGILDFEREKEQKVILDIGLSAVVVAVIFLQNGLTVNANTPVYIITAIIFYKHIPNIVRLFKGNEQKV